MSMLSTDELEKLSAAESLFPSPIPVQSISSDEFMPAPQTGRQREFEARVQTALAATHAHTAVLLARLYELARYAPLDEPLTPDELAEGRRLVCQLAGVSAA